MKKEKFISGQNGFVMLTIFILICITGILVPSLMEIHLSEPPSSIWSSLLLTIVSGIMMAGFSIIKPNEALVITFFGKYHVRFVDVQSEAAVRNLAGSYPYDNLEDEHAEITLRGGGEEVNNMLETALTERLAIAGIKVIEARISNLAYAPEIAGAMLQRQQATAIVAARYKIVEGAVSMVELALKQLSEKKVIELDDDKKAAMASNLMVVLTSDRSASPVVNTGTLYN